MSAQVSGSIVKQNYTLTCEFRSLWYTSFLITKFTTLKIHNISVDFSSETCAETQTAGRMAYLPLKSRFVFEKLKSTRFDRR